MADTSRDHRLQRVRWYKKESAYGSQISDGEATSILAVMEPGNQPWSRLPKIGNDRGTLGKGHEFASTLRRVLGWDSRVTENFSGSAEMMGWYAAFGMGSLSTTSLGGGLYRHDCTALPQSTAVQLPSTSIIDVQGTEGLKSKFSGVCVNKFNVTGKAGEWFKCTGELIGSGKEDRTTNPTVPSASVFSPLKFTEIGTFTIGASASEVTQITRLREVTQCEWDNDLLNERGYQAGATENDGGPIRSRLEFGMRNFMFKAVLDAGNAANLEWTAHAGQTLYGLTLTATHTDSSAIFKIVIPECYIIAEPKFDGNVKVYEVAFDGRYVTANTGPCKISVTNTVASMLTAAA